VDWNDLKDARALERYVAQELRGGFPPGRLRLRLIDMGIGDEAATSTILAVQAEGPRKVLARHRPAGLRRWIIAASLMVVGVVAILISASYVDQDYLRWPVFVLSGGGLLSVMGGVSLVAR